MGIDMYLTLAALVFFGSIVVFFNREFQNLFKKIFSNTITILFIPLIVASWIVYTFDYWVFWGLSLYRETLELFINALVYIIPFHKGAMALAAVIVLSCISVIPVILLKIFIRKKHFKSFDHIYIASTLIFIVSASVLLITNPPIAFLQ